MHNMLCTLKMLCYHEVCSIIFYCRIILHKSYKSLNTCKQKIKSSSFIFHWHLSNQFPLDLTGAEKCNVIIIGAGMSGLNAAKKLKEIGVPFAVYEKGAQLGGTWLDLHKVHVVHIVRSSFSSSYLLLYYFTFTEFLIGSVISKTWHIQTFCKSKFLGTKEERKNKQRKKELNKK